MKRIRNVLSSLMREQKHKRLRSAAAVSMALTVLFGVYGSMIRPAESLANSRASPTAYCEEAPEDIAKVLNAANPLPIFRTDDASKTGLTQVTADVTGKLLDHSENITKYTVDLTVDFHITSEDVTNLKNHDNSICFNLDFDKNENVRAIINEQTETELTGNVVSSDPSYSGYIGTYRLDVATGVVTIKFDMECAYFLERQGQDIGGGYTFKAYVWNDNNSDEDRTVNIAGYEVVVPIHRYANPSALSVEKAYNNDFFYPTQGKTMQNRKSLGSSFTIRVSGKAESADIQIEDTLESNHVHFDLDEATDYPVYDSDGNEVNGIYFRVTRITETSKGQLLRGKLYDPSRPDDNQVFNNTFEYSIKCPVAVNDEYLTENGSAVDTQLLKVISGNNSVTASADGKSDDASAPIQVNLKADIAKYDGVYNAATNTMHWKVTIYKDNGWWQNGVLNIGDFFVNSNYAEFGDSSEITAANGADTTRKPIGKNLTLKVVPGSNTNDGSEGSAPVTGGVDASEHGITFTTDGNGITINMPTGTDAGGQVWNEEPIKEFIIEYDTDVTDLDYGSTLNNWTGLERPTGGYTDQDTKPGSVPKPEIRKSSVYSESAGTVTWTITVQNPYNQELKGLKINDILTADDGTEVSVDFDKAVFSPDIKEQMDIEGNTAVFKTSESFTASAYTITYVQELGSDGSKGVTFNNTAELVNSGNIPISRADDSFHIPDEYEVEKDSAFTSDGKLQYGITLKNTYGSSLNGTTFSDTVVFSGADSSADDFTVTVANAVRVDSESGLVSSGQNRGLLYYEEVSGDKITLKFFIDDESENSLSYPVSYTVEPKDGDFRSRFGINVSNTVGWNGKNDSTYDTSQKYTSLGGKTAEHDYLRNLIIWRFTVYNPNGTDLGKYAENGTVKAVEDTMFTQIKSFKVFDADGSDVTKSGDTESVKANGAYTFSEGMTSKAYTFEYTTMPEKSDNYTNSVTYDGDSKSVTKWVNTRSYISKNIAKSSAVSDEGTAEVRWNVDIDTYTGGLFDKPITDSMSAESFFADPAVDVSGTEHYMTSEQFDLSDFKISYYTASESNQYSDLNYGELLDNPENYFVLEKTAGTDEKVTGFTLKVKDGLDPDSEEYRLLESIIRMRVEYSTTESGISALKDVNSELGDKLEYKNTSGFDGRTAEKTDTREKNPVITKYDVTNGNYNTNENAPKTYRLEDLTQSGGAYILKYKLEINYHKSIGAGEDITVTDRLPPGTELDNISYSLDDKYLWGQSFTETDSCDFGTDSGCAVVKTPATSTEGQIVTMYFPADEHEGGRITVEYTVRLPKDSINGLKDENNRITLNNRAETGDDFDMQPIVINTAEEAVSKQLINGADGDSNSLEYQLDINPGREKLSLDGTGCLNLEDTINDAGSGKAAAPFRFSEVNANAVSVYVVSGDPETETPIDFETYKDTFTFYEPQKTTLPVDLPYDVYNDKGVQHIITSEERAAAKGDVYKLRFKIPDETHIRIKYTYTYDMYVAIDGLDINVKNQAVITGQSLKDENVSSFKYSKAMDDAAQAYTYDHYSLIKVSKENYLDTLKGAEFELMRYSIDGGWEYLTGYENKNAYSKIGDNYHDFGVVPIAQWKKAGTEYGEVSSGMVFTTNDNGMVSFPNLQKETASDGRIYLDYDLEGSRPKYIYRLHEIKTPSGYYTEDGEEDYFFYETKKGVFTARPQTVIDHAAVNGGLPASAEIHEKEVGTTIQLANDKMRFGVRKKWLDNDPSGRSDSVTVELWQSDEPPAASAVPTVRVNVYLGNHSFVIQNEKPFSFAFKAGKNEYFSFRIDADGVWDYSGTDDLDRNGSTFTTKQPVTGDTEFTIITQGNNFTACNVVQLSETVVSGDTLFDKNAGNAVLVDTAVLNEQNGWFAEFGTKGLDSTKYYYIVETDEIEFYNKSYVVTGLQNAGTFELENVEDTVPKSTVTVGKNWLNDAESDVTSLQFEIVGCSEQAAQPQSSYSPGTIGGTYVKLHFEGSDAAYDNHYIPEFTFDRYIPVEAGRDYRLEIGGRSYHNDHVKTFTLNGTDQRYLGKYTMNSSSPGAVFTLSIPDGADGEIPAEITISFSLGSAESATAGNWGWIIPTSANYELSCEDGSGTAVTVYVSEDDYIAATAAAGAGADTDDTAYPKAEVNMPDDSTIVVPSKTFTVTKDGATGKWSGTTPLLPLTVNGEPVYYYIREADGTDFIPIYYSANGFTLNENETKTVNVVNQKTVSNGFVLPETGGKGRKLYIIIGAGLMICAGTIYIIKKRRNVS